MLEFPCPFEDDSVPPHAPDRIWWRQLLALNAVVASGLFCASGRIHPKVVGNLMGDVLWAAMVFLLAGIALRGRTTQRIATLSLAFCFAVEFAQLLHWPWLEALRSTRLGYLALGSTFNAPDLVAYTAGIGLGVLVEKSGWISAELRNSPG